MKSFFDLDGVCTIEFIQLLFFSFLEQGILLLDKVKMFSRRDFDPKPYCTIAHSYLRRVMEGLNWIYENKQRVSQLGKRIKGLEQQLIIHWQLFQPNLHFVPA